MGSPIEEPAVRIEAMRQVAPLEAALDLQRSYEARREEARSEENPQSPEEANDASITWALRAQGLEATREAGGSFQEDNMPELLREPGYRLLALEGLGIGHAIAVYRPPADSADQRLRIFDPNAGEFAIGTDKDLIYFFRALRNSYIRHGSRYFGVTAYRLAEGQEAR